MNSNNGIIATGGSQAAGNAIASAEGATAEVRDNRLAQSGQDPQRTSQEIGDLLGQLIDELGRSDHLRRADLIEAAEDAKDELDSETPRVGKLKLMSQALTAAIPAATAMGALAATIEKAIHAL
ncbi:hypothetical protein [Actinomadura harenae]|uniref:Uncharacterized protein n=1 Tax=Actinomadura harenae TaxID=2483351 RepID=A0A3M2LK60_9ACTN|nr:hypothetical protein [Actinomadura harenae]RMI37516.1 hypothetical protein EBO15_35740 [Actinomadura harenae]